VSLGGDLAGHELLGEAVDGLDPQIGAASGWIHRERDAGTLGLDESHDHHSHREIVFGHTRVCPVGARSGQPQRSPHQSHRPQQHGIVVDLQERPVLTGEGRGSHVLRGGRRPHGEQPVRPDFVGEPSDFIGQLRGHLCLEEGRVYPLGFGTQPSLIRKPLGSELGDETIQARSADEPAIAVGGDRTRDRDPCTDG